MTLPSPMLPIFSIPAPGDELLTLQTLLKAHDRLHNTDSRIIEIRIGKSNADWIATVSHRPAKPIAQALL